MEFDLAVLLEKPIAPTSDYIGEIDEETDTQKYFDPWEPFTLLYGSYSSGFDDMAIRVLTDIQHQRFDNHSLADEMFREMLCNLDFCDYGTSPRVCFASQEFRKLLPRYIEKWKEYYKVQWNEEYIEEN